MKENQIEIIELKNTVTEFFKKPLAVQAQQSGDDRGQNQ